MTQIEKDLLGALKALREAALTMTSGKLHSGADSRDYSGRYGMVSGNRNALVQSCVDRVGRYHYWNDYHRQEQR